MIKKANKLILLFDVSYKLQIWEIDNFNVHY
jgi:hypothetical protein